MIRPAIPADLPTIAAFIRELAEYERIPHLAVFDETQLGDHLFGPRPYAEVLIAEADGQPVGFALFFHTFSTFGGKPGLYLEDLFVRPAFRGRGLGKGLLVELAKLAADRGCGRVEWSVLNWNEPAIGFYRSLGAEPMGEWTVYRVSGPALTALAARSPRHP